MTRDEWMVEGAMSIDVEPGRNAAVRFEAKSIVVKPYKKARCEKPSGVEVLSLCFAAGNGGSIVTPSNN